MFARKHDKLTVRLNKFVRASVPCAREAARTDDRDRSQWLSWNGAATAARSVIILCYTYCIVIRQNVRDWRLAKSERKLLYCASSLPVVIKQRVGRVVFSNTFFTMSRHGALDRQFSYATVVASMLIFRHLCGHSSCRTRAVNLKLKCL